MQIKLLCSISSIGTQGKTGRLKKCFSIAVTSLGEERANLNAFRTFVRFALFFFFFFGLFSLPLVVWGGLRRLFVALPGLYPYLLIQNLVYQIFIEPIPN